jgi:hypothetical protein
VVCSRVAPAGAEIGGGSGSGLDFRTTDQPPLAIDARPGLDHPLAIAVLPGAIEARGFRSIVLSWFLLRANDMSDDAALRKELEYLLTRGNAHVRFDDTVHGFPVNRAGERPANSPHSAWEVLEHIRIAQEDIVRFSGALAAERPTGQAPPEGYVELRFPEDYWPSSSAPANRGQWERSVAAIRENLESFIRLLKNPAINLHDKFPWGSGQTLLREALVLADHNSYHLGQLMLIRRMLEEPRPTL